MIEVSVDENLRIVRSMYRAFNAHDGNRQTRFCAESVVHTAPGLPEPLKGRDALRKFNEAWFKAFPDFDLKEVRAFGQGEWVCYEHAVTGTNTGPLPALGGRTVPPTNKTIQATGCDVIKVEGGEISEIHSYFDLMGIMAKLGLGPA